MPTPETPLSSLPSVLHFGRFELRPQERRLLGDGEPVTLGGRAFDLLLALVQRAGQLVTRNELIEQVWPGRVVEENNLSVQINALRKVLGGDGLATVPGRGYRFVAPLLPAASGNAAQHAASHGPRTNLPALQPLLMGRSDDLAALGTLIDQHRLVTVVGAGGMGKTRLAQALLHLRATGYPHGVCWVELGTVSDTAALPGTVATALGVQTGAGTAVQALAQAISGMHLLVSLDNAEHLLDGVAGLAQALLDAAPGLRLVVTSQAPLRLAIERVVRLGPLAIPQAPLPAHQAQAFAAVALFAERATAADSRFVLTDAMVPAVITLCRQLDGLPLAIELAATRAPTLGVERLLASMSDRLQVLTGGRNRNAPQRQQTLRAALAWSHGLLGATEQRLFRRLAVHSGGVSLERIEAAAADRPGEGPLDAWTLLDALDHLVQRSLVELVFDEDGGNPRYRLLESPRALALEQLSASGEEQQVRRRHARAVRADWDTAEAAMYAGQFGVQAWRQGAEFDMDAVRDALAWARREGDDALALALASASLLRLPAALHDERAQLSDACEALAACVDDVAAGRRAWSAIAVAWANRQPPRALRAARRALELARKVDHIAMQQRPADADRFVLYDALCEAAGNVSDDEQLVQAECLLQEARAIEDPDWPPVRLRAAARVAARIATRRGDKAALPLLQQVLQLGLAAGDPSLATQVNITDIYLSNGDFDAAVQAGSKLVAQLTQLAHPRNEAFMAAARINLAAAHIGTGQLAEARAGLRLALGPVLRMQRLVWCGDHLALLAALEGRLDAAAQLAGMTDARHEVQRETRHPSEQRARDRCAALLSAQVGAPVVAALLAQGRLLRDADVEALAFG